MFWDGISQDCPPGGVNANCPSLPQTKAQKLVDTMEYIFDTYFEDNSDSTSFASIVPYSGFVNLYPYSTTMVKQATIQPDWIEEQPDFNIYGLIDSINKSSDNDGDYRKYSVLSRYYPFFTALGPNIPGYTQTGWTDASTQLATKDYTHVLNRIPTLTATDLTRLSAKGSDTSSSLFENYTYLINYLTDKNLMVNTNNPLNFFATGNESIPAKNPKPNEMYRRMMCYNGMISAALDQRIERDVFAKKRLGERDGEAIASQYISTLNGGRGIELHESFPVQPLTNELSVLKQLLNRFTSDEYLYSENNSKYLSSEVMDRQRSRLNKSFDFSAISDTSSIHGLLWSWFNLSNDWQGKWDNKSITEKFCDEGGANLELFQNNTTCDNDGNTSQAKRSSSSLPNEDHTKYIIMISDGYDIDGQEAGGAVTSGQSSLGAGFLMACDAHSPIERVGFNEYSDICERINEDGIKVHTILYGFTPDGSNDGYQKDKIESRSKYSEELSRFEACSKVTDGTYHPNVSPNDNGSGGKSLKETLDSIFLGILTDLTPVRLID